MVVNLFGAPGSGKSTLALLTAGYLKVFHPDLTVECPDEIAKTKVYDEATKVLGCQIYTAGRQFWQVARCEGHADIVVCDSPILLSAVYGEMLEQPTPTSFRDVCLHYHTKHRSLNYFMVRQHRFESRARIHDETQAEAIAERIKAHLTFAKIPHEDVSSSVDTALTIAQDAAGLARHYAEIDRK